MTTVAVRLSEGELDYLTAITKKVGNSGKKSSPGKTLKALLKWCADNQIDITSSYEKPKNSSRKLLEQVHVSIPHILYLSRLHVLMDSDKIPDEVVARSKQQAIDYLNAVCGEFQHMEYTEIKGSTNDIGLKQLPIETKQSNWES